MGARAASGPTRINFKGRAANLQSYPPGYATANSERRSFDVSFAALSPACHSMPSNYGLSAHRLREVGRRTNPLS